MQSITASNDVVRWRHELALLWTSEVAQPAARFTSGFKHRRLTSQRHFRLLQILGLARSPISARVARMKVLIAGGAGFIGSTISSACLDAGINPVILDNLSTGRAEFARERIFYPGDISDGPLIDKIFTEHPDIDAVVHAAAAIVVHESLEQPLRYYRENVAKSVDFIDHVLRNGATRCVFSSSAAIYAPGPDFAVDETSPLSPASPYARTKLIMERVLQDTAAASLLRTLSLRYFNPIGADPQLRTGPQGALPPTCSASFSSPQSATKSSCLPVRPGRRGTVRASATSSTSGTSPKHT